MWISLSCNTDEWWTFTFYYIILKAICLEARTNGNRIKISSDHQKHSANKGPQLNLNIIPETC